MSKLPETFKGACMALSRAIVLMLLLLGGGASAVAEDNLPRQQCWTPAELAGTASEIKHQRSKGALDLAALKRVVPPPATPVPSSLRGLIGSVELPPDRKLIALTFDLCEESGYVSGYDGRIVDLLRAQGIKATFFAGGKWMETHPERAAQLIADPLFEVGSHGLSHADLSKTNEAKTAEEIALTEAAYTRAKTALTARQCVLGAAAPAPPEQLRLFRFPYGRCNAKSLAAAGDAGLLAVQWDVVTGDPDPRVSAKTIANTILTRAHPGAIVVAHANGRGSNTAAALAVALPKLKEQGYSFVTVSELLEAGKPIIAQACSQPKQVKSRRIARESKQRSGHDLFSLFHRRN
jgi:peptidoglycan/xylan/chitin deacetylase (PgdA/CDA1 family)